MLLRDLSTTEFAYWLQGAFEISGCGTLSEEQVEKIMQRLCSLKELDQHTFCNGYILTHYEIESASAGVRKLQNELFVHDIDPSYAGDQDFFHAVHRG